MFTSELVRLTAHRALTFHGACRAHGLLTLKSHDRHLQLLNLPNSARCGAVHLGCGVSKVTVSTSGDPIAATIVVPIRFIADLPMCV